MAAVPATLSAVEARSAIRAFVDELHEDSPSVATHDGDLGVAFARLHRAVRQDRQVVLSEAARLEDSADYDGWEALAIVVRTFGYDEASLVDAAVPLVMSGDSADRRKGARAIELAVALLADDGDAFVGYFERAARAARPVPERLIDQLIEADPVRTFDAARHGPGVTDAESELYADTSVIIQQVDWWAAWRSRPAHPTASIGANVVDEARRMVGLVSKSRHRWARAYAAHLLATRDHLSDPALLQALINDSNPSVRRSAVPNAARDVNRE